jgi:hypothetical protein
MRAAVRSRRITLRKTGRSRRRFRAPSPYRIINGHDDDQVARLLDAQLQRDADLTFFEYMVLALLSGQPGRTMPVSALAAAISASLSRLSHVASAWKHATASPGSAAQAPGARPAPPSPTPVTPR